MKPMHVLLAAIALTAASHSAAQVVLYEHDNFRGRSLEANRSMGNFERQNFNDIASSAVVRGGSWELCEDAGFRGHCIVLKPGRYRSLGALGINDRISSVRPANTRAARRDDRRGPVYDDRGTPHGAPGSEAGMYPRR